MFIWIFATPNQFSSLIFRTWKPHCQVILWAGFTLLTIRLEFEKWWYSDEFFNRHFVICYARTYWRKIDWRCFVVVFNHYWPSLIEHEMASEIETPKNSCDTRDGWWLFLRFFRTEKEKKNASIWEKRFNRFACQSKQIKRIKTKYIRQLTQLFSHDDMHLNRAHTCTWCEFFVHLIFRFKNDGKNEHDLMLLLLMSNEVKKEGDAIKRKHWIVNNTTWMWLLTWIRAIVHVQCLEYQCKRFLKLKKESREQHTKHIRK